MRRSGFCIMKELIKLVSPLIGVMIGAITTGVLGFLDSIFIVIVAAYGLLGEVGYKVPLNQKEIIILLLILGVMRGVLRYAEQYSNHYVAFKLLALIRDKVFSALRRLSPAKLEGKDKGILISIITSDIELLEVFYAHTISPVAIAFIVSLVMVIYVGKFHWIYGLIALLGYATIGILVPLVNSSLGREDGLDYRNEVGEMNTYLLDSLRGLREIMQYDQGDKRQREIYEQTQGLSRIQRKLIRLQSFTSILSEMCIYVFSGIMLATGFYLYSRGKVDVVGVVIPTVTMLSSFGPVVALASLSNNLFHTFAAGDRILDILEETPVVSEVYDGKDIKFEKIMIYDVSFSYDEEVILDKVNMEFPRDKIIGIYGKSGSGKSTLLKLIMRFWDVNQGKIEMNSEDIKNINTSSLRDNQAYVTQETQLFNDTIKNNIKIAKLDAKDEEIIEACKKASIHEFIKSLPKGYDTNIGELGDSLSGGERQRIGIARAFLHDAPLLLLDEPTSNLDSLNEGIILKSLKEQSEEKTVILVSHRTSTLGIADQKYHVESKRVS
ncbi:MAG: ABC transporter ATP-binding protein/permease [Xylanivirga thermophila]|uniref:amino acid ABC transporter ATP-binding/permease protein n=1 Tax=Xylanivirga thermophila TaxID=2496273 RepID=UPI0039F5B155